MLREFFEAHSRALIATLCTLFCVHAHAQTSQPNATCTNAPAQTMLLSEVHTIADSTQGVPVECTFNVSVTGNYKVELTDLGVVPDGSTPPTPAPLASVKLGVTSGSTLVGTQLAAPGSMQFNAAIGTYVIHVVGVPGPAFGSGPIGIQVTNVGDNSTLASFFSTLDLPKTAVPSNQTNFADTFTVPSDGSYTVTLADLHLPQPLTAATLLLTTGTTVVTILQTAGSISVPLQHGTTYRLKAIGLADAAVNAGLFGISVSPAAGGAVAYSKLIPVGTVVALDSVALNSGGTYTLSLADLSFPSALSGLSAVLATDGQVVAQLGAAGTSAPFVSISGNYQVFALASTSATGSYAVTLAPQGGRPVLSLARAVSAQGGTAAQPFSFDNTVATAGTYTFDLADFAFPAQFTSLSAVVVQDGAVLGHSLGAPGNQSVTVATGPISVLVFAQPPSAGGLFGVDLTAGMNSAPVFQTTQGVGALFSARQVSITSAGSYAVTVGDVGFPANLSTFAVVATQGTKQFGSVYGGGNFKFPAAAGTYFINFIAQPGGTDKAGTYALDVGPAPVATLQSDATSVAAGGVVHLTWTSHDATACTASGGWSGPQILNGTATSAALSTTTTFTLTCSAGPVSDTHSVTVSIADPPPKSGGGGALSVDLLLALSAAVMLRWECSRRAKHARRF